MQTGDPIRHKGIVGTYVGDIDSNTIVADMPVEKVNEDTNRINATIERVQLPLVDVEHNFVEKNEQIAKDGKKFYTNQHGEVVV